MFAQVEFPEILEAIMLICFGVSWPVSILKTVKAKRVEGKSQLFLVLILVGYLAGVAAKVADASLNGKALPWVTWLYAFNGLLVLTDIVLFRRYRVQPGISTAPLT